MVNYNAAFYAADEPPGFVLKILLSKPAATLDAEYAALASPPPTVRSVCPRRWRSCPDAART
jgi:hypothetical protein